MKKSLYGFLLLVTISITWGCGGNNTTIVHASAPTIADVGPDRLDCGPSDQGDVCAFVTHVKDANGNVLFYCQGETHVYQSTMSYHLEIGVSSLVDGAISGCTVPMPRPAKLLNMRGNLGLTPFTGNLTSIATWVYSVRNLQREVLYPGKIMANKGLPTNITFEGSSGEPLVFVNGHEFDSFLVWFNIDLPGSVPATISVSGAGEIE